MLWIALFLFVLIFLFGEPVKYVKEGDYLVREHLLQNIRNIRILMDRITF